MDLCKNLKNLVIPENYVFLSLDVSSLYTNIPCDLAIETIEKRCNKIISNCFIHFKNIVDCTHFLFNNTFFSFNKKFYQQHSGLSMGSPISGLYADMVMTDIETRCLHLLKFIHNITPLFYYRYIDDTILSVDKNHVDTILDIFNSYHEKLKFTYEIEIKNSISFLDTLLINQNNKITTNWYKKPTSSDRFINFTSKHPIQQKRAMVYNLVDRSILLSNQ